MKRMKINKYGSAWKLMICRVSFMPIIPLILKFSSLLYLRHKSCTLQIWTLKELYSSPKKYQTVFYSIFCEFGFTCVCDCTREIFHPSPRNIYSIFMISCNTWYALLCERIEWTTLCTGYMFFCCALDNVSLARSLCAHLASLHFRRFCYCLNKIFFFTLL